MMGTQEKRGREVYGRLEYRGWGGGVPNVAGSGRNREIMQNCTIFHN